MHLSCLKHCSLFLYSIFRIYHPVLRYFQHIP